MSTHATVGTTLTVLYAAVLCLVLVFAAKSRNGTLPRNAFAGVRLRQTRANDDAWQAGQLAARRHYLRLAPVLALACAAVLANTLAGGPLWVYTATVLVSGALDIPIAVASVTAARRAAVPEHPPPH